MTRYACPVCLGVGAVVEGTGSLAGSVFEAIEDLVSGLDFF